MQTCHDFDPRFAPFRAKDASDFDESAMMTTLPLTEAEMAGSIAAVEAGVLDGTTVKLLFAMPGMSLTRAWFKSDFPLPRHTHDVDCLYYIVAGSLRIGTETLSVGDGFYIGADVPYAYTPGPDGVEVLEFRASNSFNIKLLANNPDFWATAVERTSAKQSEWAKEFPPSTRGNDSI